MSTLTENFDNLDILETRRTSKQDNILYIALRNKRDIREVYARKADCRSDDTVIRNFIPPQVFDRFAQLNKICTTKRSLDKNLKTQVRFGDKDLEVWTKNKGEDEPFRIVDLKDFIEDETLADFDFTVKWKVQKDRRPRRRTRSKDRSCDRGRPGRPVMGEKGTIEPAIDQTTQSE